MYIIKFISRYYRLFSIWIILIPVIAVGQEIKIKHLLTIGDKEENYFAQIRDICVADDSSFFVADWK